MDQPELNPLDHFGQEFFKHLDKELDSKLDNRFKSLEKSLIIKLGTFILTVIIVAWGAGFTLLTWAFDYKFGVIDDEIKEIRYTAFSTPQKNITIEEIREVVKAEMASFHVKPVKRKKSMIKRKVNNLPDSSHGIALEEK